MSASFAGFMSTRVCRAKAFGHGFETMQLETQLTRPRSDMLAAEAPRASRAVLAIQEKRGKLKYTSRQTDRLPRLPN